MRINKCVNCSKFPQIIIDYYDSNKTYTSQVVCKCGNRGEMAESFNQRVAVDVAVDNWNKSYSIPFDKS